MTILYAQLNGNWNDTNQWNTKVNGTGSHVIPSVNDICIANGKTVVININITVKQLRTNYKKSNLGGVFQKLEGVIVNADCYGIESISTVVPIHDDSNINNSYDALFPPANPNPSLDTDVLYAQLNGNWNDTNQWNTKIDGSGIYRIPDSKSMCVANGKTIIINQDIQVYQLRTNYTDSLIGGKFEKLPNVVINADCYGIKEIPLHVIVKENDNTSLYDQLRGPIGPTGPIGPIGPTGPPGEISRKYIFV